MIRENDNVFLALACDICISKQTKIPLELFDRIDTIRAKIHIRNTIVSSLCTVVYKNHTAIVSELNLCSMLSPTYLPYVDSIQEILVRRISCAEYTKATS